MSGRLRRRSLRGVATPARPVLLVVATTAVAGFLAAFALATVSSGPRGPRPADVTPGAGFSTPEGSPGRGARAPGSSAPAAAALRAVAPLPELRRQRRPRRPAATIAGPTVAIAIPDAPEWTPTPTPTPTATPSPSPSPVVPQAPDPPAAPTPEPTFDSSGETSFDSSG